MKVISQNISKMKITISIFLNMFLSISFYTAQECNSVILFVLVLHGFTISVLETVKDLVPLYVFLLCTGLIWLGVFCLTVTLQLGQMLRG